MRRAPLSALCVFVAGWAWAASAEDAPRLSLPLDCAIGQDCAILQYADLDPGPGALDRSCGSLSYDGHGGTDFYLLRLELLDAGVPVLAAADGKVQAENATALDRRRLLKQVFVGLKRPEGGWPPGVYRGEYSLSRGGETLFTTVREIRRD